MRHAAALLGGHSPCEGSALALSGGMFFAINAFEIRALEMQRNHSP
jgi:hypothetical protein